MPLNDKRIEMRKKVDSTSYQLIWTLLKDTFPQKMPEFSNLIIWFLTKWNEDRIIWFDDNNGGGDTKRRKNSTTTTTRNRNICFSMKLKLKEQGLILTIIIEQFIYSTENKQTWDKRQETHIHTTPQTHIHTSPAASRFIFLIEQNISWRPEFRTWFQSTKNTTSATLKILTLVNAKLNHELCWICDLNQTTWNRGNFSHVFFRSKNDFVHLVNSIQIKMKQTLNIKKGDCCNQCLTSRFMLCRSMHDIRRNFFSSLSFV